MTSQPPHVNRVSVQKTFLEHLRKSGESVTVFLVNGVKLQGVIVLFDDETFLLRREGHVQLVYKHAVSTVMPVAAVSGLAEEMATFDAALSAYPAAGDF